MPRDVVLHGALLEGTGTQMDKPLPEMPSGRRALASRRPVSSWISTSWWSSAQSSPTNNNLTSSTSLDLTKQDKTAAKFPDLVRREVTATAPNTKWVGDITEIPTAAGKLYLATVIDLYSRRLLGAATSRHPDADLACAAIRMAIAVRFGTDSIRGVVFHTDRGSTCTATDFTTHCVGTTGSVSRWAGWGRASTTPPPRRSSPPWSGRSCPGMTSPTPTPTTPNASSRTGAGLLQHPPSSQLGCDDGTASSRPPPPSSRRRHNKPSTTWGEPHRDRSNEAEDEQREADDGDDGFDAPVVLRKHRDDREGSFEVAVAAFDAFLALVPAQHLGGVRDAGSRLA